jgi:hypothetical protein
MNYLESLKDNSNESFFSIFRKRPRLESGLIIKYLEDDYIFISLDSLYGRDLLIEYANLFNNSFHYTELAGIVFNKKTKQFSAVTKNENKDSINTIFESLENKPNIDFLFHFNINTPLIIGGTTNDYN